MIQFFANLSLKRKIQAIAFSSIVLLSIAALFSIRLVASTYDRMLYQTTASSLSHSSTELRGCLENLNTMADLFLADPTVQSNLGVLKDSDNSQEISVAHSTIYSTLAEYFFNFRKDHVNYMSFYQNDYAIHTRITSMRGGWLPAEIEADLRNRAEAAEGATIWISDYSKDYGLFMVKCIRRTEYLKLDSLGTLVVNVDLDGLISEANSPGFLQEDSAYLLFDDQHLIYSSDQLPLELTADYQNSFDSFYNSISIENRNYFYVRSTIPSFHWKYVCIIPYDNIRESLNTSIQLCLMIIAAAIGISFMLSTTIINSILRHFNALIRKMKHFGDGNREPLQIDYDYQHRRDELGILHQQFDHMVDEVNQLIRTNYLNEILIKEAQFKALENQMNPHFLYNTLESINWRAKILGAKDISSMAENLGTLLRITLDQRSTHIPLQKELDLIQCYMTIQKHRYEDRLDYRVLVPEHLLNCSVLKLTLQPLVENSIRYGLEENTERCMIQVIAETDAEHQTLILYVKNNGSSFEDDLIHKLETHEIEPHGFGIGLLNIKNRMQITFGDDYGLDLYNEDELAVVRLTYPLNTTLKGELSC